MLAVLQVWLGQVCNGDVSRRVQLLVEKEGMAVDTLSVSMRTGREQDQDGDYKWGNQWFSCEKIGTQRQRKQDGGSTTSPASFVTCAHLTSSLHSHTCDPVSPMCCDPSGQEWPLHSSPLRWTSLAFKANLRLHAHYVLTFLALPLLWGSTAEYLAVT